MKKKSIIRISTRIDDFSAGIMPAFSFVADPKTAKAFEIICEHKGILDIILHL